MNQEVTRGWIARQVTRRYKVRKRSKTVTVLTEEVYLRDDISCGSALCRSCTQDSPPLPVDPTHYLVPDANALIQFLEIWELPQISAVIYLASVIKEVLNRVNSHNYRRLRALFTDRRRQSFFFDDEHFIYTWSLQRDPQYVGGAKQSGKRVQAVALWFFEHLQGSIRIVALQSNDESAVSADTSNLEKQLTDLSFTDYCKSKSQNLEVLSVENYFKEFWLHDSSVSELYASLMLSLSEGKEKWKLGKDSSHTEVAGRRGGKGVSTYKEHLLAHLVEADLASGALRVGVFHVNSHDPLEGYVHPSNKGEASLLDIFIPGRMLQNRALPGDLVVVRMLERGYWQAAKQNSQMSKKAAVARDPARVTELPDLVDEADTSDRVDYAAEQVGDVQEKVTQKVVPTGEIVGIVQRFQRDYVACLAQEDEEALSQSGSGRREYLLCVPMDRRIPMVRLATRLVDRLLGQRFVIRIDGWDKDSRIPKGHFVRLLGPIGDLTTETMALLVENGINTSPFSSASKQELPEDSKENPWTIPKEEFLVRRDLRFSHRTCSIDPPGSKDVDDTLSVRPVQNNLLEIGVHIADVSYFVQQNSLLDLEARARGTTVYMVGKSWQMLPSILSENLCSLKGGKERLSVSVIWTVDPENDFEILDVWFGRTIIQSRHQLFYAQAQAIVDGQILPPGWEITGGPEEVAAVESDLLVLARFAQVRRDLRKANGALELSSSELQFETAANKEPISVDTKLELPMNWIVAEMMILANSYVAMKTYQSFPTMALLRKHDPPRLDNFTLMLECCAARGFSLDTSSNKTLSNSLDHMRDSNDPFVEDAVRALATRAMSEAEYCSTAESSDISGFYHYGLALEFYTHFTSPIRRYADVLVHRMLVVACKEGSGLVKANNVISPNSNPNLLLHGLELKEITHHLNERHRASKRAQKECNELYLLMYLQKHAKAEHAVVVSIYAKAMMVFVPKYDVRVPIYLQDKKGTVILPLENDSAGSEMEEFPQSENLSLVKQSGTVKITDAKSGRLILEYKLMDSVWVQLRADGSRAHAPKLRVRLLSPSHPSVKMSMLQNGSKLQNGIVPRRYHASMQSISGKRVIRKGDKKQVVQDMVKIVAAEEVLQKRKRRESLQTKDSTIHDVFEDFKRRKVSSIYLNVEDYGSLDISFPTGSLSHQKFGGANCDDWLSNGPLTLSTKISKAIPKPEELVMEQFRKLWYRRLSRASKLRATQMWSILDEEAQKQIKRSDREKQERQKALVLGSLLQ